MTLVRGKLSSCCKYPFAALESEGKQMKEELKVKHLWLFLTLWLNAPKKWTVRDTHWGPSGDWKK